MIQTRDSDVAAIVDEHVLGLEVTENNVQIVQVFKRKHRLRREEARLLLVEAVLLLLLDVCEHLSAVHKLEDEVERLCVLEVVEQPHNEGKVKRVQDVLLVGRVLDLASFDDAILGDDLHGAEVACRRLLLHEKHSAKRARSQRSVDEEVMESL